MADDETFYDRIAPLREKFAEEFAGSINSGVYDERDIERIRLEDENVRAYLRHQKGDVEKAAAMMDSVLKWRKEMEINDLGDKYFPREFHDLGAVYWHNKDKDGNKILYFAVRKNKKDPERYPLVKKFIAWQINKHFIKSPEHKIVALLDMSDAGFSNIDMDLIKFQISCFTTFFPGQLSYMLIFEMPWVLNAIWKVIKTILSAEQQKKVIFVKRGEVQDYIHADQLWKHMGGNDAYQYTYIPSEDSGIDIQNGDMMTPTDEGEEADDLFMLASESNNTSNSSLRKRVTFSESDPVVYTSFEAEPDVPLSGQNNLSNNNVSASNNNKNSSETMSIALRRASELENNLNSLALPLLTICPGEELEFGYQEDSRDAMDIISLKNTSDQTLAFKVKTTSPEKYRVRPSTGIIHPRGQSEVNVYLHSGQDMGVLKDKFLIMFMPVQEEVSISQVNDMFKSTSREKYNEHRLRCRMGLGSSTVLLETASHLARTKPAVVTDLLNEQMEAILRQQKKFESQMKIVQVMLGLLLFFVFIACLGAFLYYWLELLPSKPNEYTLNTCNSQPL